MQRLSVGLLTTALLAIHGGAAFAQGDGPHTVSFSMTATQPSLRDAKLNDKYQTTIGVDGWGKSMLEVECSAGSSGPSWSFGLVRKNEACKVSGSTSIINPANGQELPRLQYSGGFEIKGDQDGYTNMETVSANYLRLGSAPAQNGSFNGSVIMKPKNPPASARELGARLVSYLQQEATGTGAVSIDAEFDSIRFDNLVVPHIGSRGTVDCGWTGDMIYAYANDSWQMSLTANCGGSIHQLEGNMPWVDIEGQSHNAEYVINLMTAEASGGDPFAEADPFAAVEGISGTIKMTQSGFVEVKIGESETDTVAANIKAEGEIVGNSVPVDLTYSFAQLMAIFARSMFGA